MQHETKGNISYAVFHKLLNLGSGPCLLWWSIRDRQGNNQGLARLAIWIHTFVPGLPLSFLDHNLVCGNSLIGIADFAEVRNKLTQDDLPLFQTDPSHLLGVARRIASGKPIFLGYHPVILKAYSI